jgi:hypothetical protein
LGWQALQIEKFFVLVDDQKNVPSHLDRLDFDCSVLVNNHCILDKRISSSRFLVLVSISSAMEARRELTCTTFPPKSRHSSLIKIHDWLAPVIDKNLLCRGWPFMFCLLLLWKMRWSVIICGRGKQAPTSCCCWLENN